MGESETLEKPENLLKKLEEGWEGHKKADPPLNFESNAECSYCETKFKITLEENVKKEKVLVYLGPRCKAKWAYLGGADWEKAYQQVIRYQTVCPECGNKDELFCVPDDPRKVVKI